MFDDMLVARKKVATLGMDRMILAFWSKYGDSEHVKAVYAIKVTTSLPPMTDLFEACCTIKSSRRSTPWLPAHRHVQRLLWKLK
jgi:hypothetical protein